MQRPLHTVIFLLSLLPASVIYLALLGLGLHRHAPAGAVSAAATGLLFGPPLLASVWRRQARLAFGGALALWSAFLLVVLPLYFPGERRQALATGLALLGEDWDEAARHVAEHLPDEPNLGQPELPQADTVVALEAPAPLLLADHEIALPYEGRGRRLTVPVAFEHDGETVETSMLLDTGATYTTLPADVLKRLGITVPSDAPELELHTANGTRKAKVVLLDRVWLGDQSVDGVAITECADCGGGDASGLLGLNITGGFNLLIDADRREAVFSARTQYDRSLDITPFVDLDASFTGYPGGRVEVSVTFQSTAPRPVQRVDARVECGPHRWLITASDLPPGGRTTTTRRLPAHTACEPYRIAIDRAWWAL